METIFTTKQQKKQKQKIITRLMEGKFCLAAWGISRFFKNTKFKKVSKKIV